MSMNSDFLTPPAHGFAGFPICVQLNNLEADIAIIGLHYVSPYPRKSVASATQTAMETAPDAIRLQSSRFTGYWDHYDFDFNDVLLADRQIRMVDCGDVDRKANGSLQNPERITAVIRTILARGAMPVALGTDEGGFIPFVRAFDGCDDLCLVHIDAHIDWRNELNGVGEGYSSGMRRASEMPWVKAMVQVGLRGIGSARRQEVNDALLFGSVFIRAREVHQKGIDACIDKIPAADHYLITIDMDALDTAIAPGVLFPSPGGLSFDEVTDLVQGIASKGRIAGISLFELRPERDINGLTASTGAQLIINFIGTLAHSGQIGK
ncbi:MAG: arginase family protein [Deltaproteobacteria bacterium]|nr:arginase family protein [Deltaproteobacteria bacterium]